ncbi:MAG: HAMP domain-containing protein [Candidatus Electrothrix sp. MAN1_4]|nr:HAMP domain-containing protein [Candidatus Electrothrix sp. MAN1_4]
MSILFQAANDMSLKKKACFFFILNFLLVIIAAAGLFYLVIQHSSETTKIIHVSLCVLFVLLLSIQVLTMLYFKNNIIQPLTEMQGASRLMADGHLETLNHIQRADEIGALGENINDLAMNMQEVLLFVWNHTRLSRDLLENIADDLNFSLDTEMSDSLVKNKTQRDINTMHLNNEDLQSIVMSFSYFEIKLHNEKMVSDYQQEPEIRPS